MLLADTGGRKGIVNSIFRLYYGCFVKKSDVICRLKCWQGRTVILHRSTLLNHVIRLHLDSAFVVDALKRNFSRPICVVRNKRHGTLNAYYDIATGEQPYLLVAVQIQKGLGRVVRKPHLIKTFFGVDQLPPGPFEWERRP
jgi:hypothetical protein